MGAVRMTQGMMSSQALTGMQTGLNRLARVQEQLSTGRVINRPSDDPTGATAAMRIRTSLADQKQFARNADDGLGWLNQVDSALSSATDQVRRARDLALQGANTGALGPEAREALAVEVDQIRAGLLSTANATYLDRPVFGGITSGAHAYDPSGTWIGAPGGTAGGVVRTVADGAKVRVDVEGPEAFGVDGDGVFAHLDALSTALRAGDSVAISGAIDKLAADATRITNTQSDVGARTKRIEQARSAAVDSELTLTSSLSEVENVDIAKAVVDLQLQEVAYKAALGATARVMQPSLLDFLR
jgi:flagellar hook-associated protein 3 FlgL